MGEKDQFASLNVEVGTIIRSRLTQIRYRVLERRGDGAVVEPLDGSGDLMHVLKLYARQFSVVEPESIPEHGVES